MVSEKLLTTSTSSSEREMRGGPEGLRARSGPFALRPKHKGGGSLTYEFKTTGFN